MKTKCNGGCGKESGYNESGKGGYGTYVNDKLVEWVCEDCWKKGSRTTAAKEWEKGRANNRV